MLYSRNNYVSRVPAVSCSKALCEGNGYSLDEYWNVVARRRRGALWVSLSMPTDCVAPLDKGLAIVSEARLAVNTGKLTEHAILTRIKH